MKLLTWGLNIHWYNYGSTELVKLILDPLFLITFSYKKVMEDEFNSVLQTWSKIFQGKKWNIELCSFWQLGSSVDLLISYIWINISAFLPVVSEKELF